MNLPKKLSVVALLVLSACVHPVPPVKKELVIVDKKSEGIIPKETPKEEKRTPKPRLPLSERNKVKVGIRIDAASVTISCKGKVKAVPLVKEHFEPQIWPAGTYTFFVDGGVLVLQGRRTYKTWELEPVNDDDFLETRDRPYRGSFVVKVTNQDKVTVINELSIDDYLQGVLPHEAVVSWPLETLKVQAVASRTYLASHLGSHGSQGFDLCSDVHCQVYGGMGKEHPKCNEAVDSTRREILTFNGKPVGAYFHSNCGGMTEKISRVWGQDDQPYLPRKKCQYGTGDPRYHWSMTYQNEEILSMLKAKGLVKGTELLSLKVREKSPSGRAQYLAIKTDEDTYTLKSNDFRIALNPEKIRSTKWSDVQKLRGAYKFIGTGWGHGIGMCQWGAKGQAEAGRNYRQILQFYYPETKITLWDRN